MTPFDAWITFAYTRDLEATTRFYGDVLGLPLVLDQGGCRIWRAAADAYIGFCDREQDERRGVMLTLVTEDVDGWYQRLLDHGVEVTQAPRHNPAYRIHHLFARDPNGYAVEIQRFDDPGWCDGPAEGARAG